MATNAHRRQMLCMMLISCLVFLCSCKNRLIKSSVQTAPRVHFERAHQLEFASDHLDGARISNIGISHYRHLPSGTFSQIGFGPSIYNRPERVPVDGVVNHITVGAFVGAVIRSSRYRFSLSLSGHEEEYTMAAALVVSFGAKGLAYK